MIDFNLQTSAHIDALKGANSSSAENIEKFTQHILKNDLRSRVKSSGASEPPTYSSDNVSLNKSLVLKSASSDKVGLVKDSVELISSQTNALGKIVDRAINKETELSLVSSNVHGLDKANVAGLEKAPVGLGKTKEQVLNVTLGNLEKQQAKKPTGDSISGALEKTPVSFGKTKEYLLSNNLNKEADLEAKLALVSSGKTPVRLVNIKTPQSSNVVGKEIIQENRIGTHLEKAKENGSVGLLRVRDALGVMNVQSGVLVSALESVGESLVSGLPTDLEGVNNSIKILVSQAKALDSTIAGKSDGIEKTDPQISLGLSVIQESVELLTAQSKLLSGATQQDVKVDLEKKDGVDDLSVALGISDSDANLNKIEDKQNSLLGAYGFEGFTSGSKVISTSAMSADKATTIRSATLPPTNLKNLSPVVELVGLKNNQTSEVGMKREKANPLNKVAPMHSSNTLLKRGFSGNLEAQSSVKDSFGLSMNHKELSNHQLPIGFDLSRDLKIDFQKPIMSGDVDFKSNIEEVATNSISKASNAKSYESKLVDLGLLVRRSALSGINSISVKLKPHELGNIEIAIKEIGGEIHLQFKVDKPETLELLESQEKQLKDNIKGEGDTLMSFSDSRGNMNDSSEKSGIEQVDLEKDGKIETEIEEGLLRITI